MGLSLSKQEYVEEDHKLSFKEIASEYLKERASFDVQTLLAAYQLRNLHPNKKIVLQICTKGAEPKGTLAVSRWRAIPLPRSFARENGDVKTVFEMHQDLYEYKNEANNEEKPKVEWYVNFADPRLFVAYEGSLFAQDEMQVAEHPSLAYLVECLRDTREVVPITRDDDRPTPILIRGIERRCKIDTRRNKYSNSGIYGNNFGRASEGAITEATKLMDPPTITNMICMAALGHGSGNYTEAQIVDLYTTAYTSFKAAIYESILQSNNEKYEENSVKPQVIVHTGNWGTGAFGGDKPLMAIIQKAAAQAAGVDKLVYHTFDNAGTNGYNRGSQSKLGNDQLTIDQIFESNLPMRDFVKSLIEKKFKWGFSDGN